MRVPSQSYSDMVYYLCLCHYPLCLWEFQVTLSVTWYNICLCHYPLCLWEFQVTLSVTLSNISVCVIIHYVSESSKSPMICHCKLVSMSLLHISRCDLIDFSTSENSVGKRECVKYSSPFYIKTGGKRIIHFLIHYTTLHSMIFLLHGDGN